MAPRLMMGSQVNNRNPHYQSIQNLPTLNQVQNRSNEFGQPPQQLREYRSRERLYNAPEDEMLVAFPNL